MKIEPDLSVWLHGGSDDDPVVEEKALQKALSCYERALKLLDDIDVWEVEYDASGRLPGLSVPLKAFVDVIGEHKKHGPTILDWKTGNKRDNFQLVTYKALLMQRDEINGVISSLDVGLWGMLAPNASVARPIDLSSVDPKEVGARYQAVYEKMQAKLYQTNAQYACRWCFQKENCLLQAGPTARAKYYDRASEDGYPFD